MMNWQALLVGGMVGLAGVWLLRRLYRSMFGGGAKGCGCGCGGGSPADRKIVRQQLISVDQLTGRAQGPDRDSS